ncbi:MAG: hypothetical protein R3Y67_05735 [Eubacteriales bacterium]
MIKRDEFIGLEYLKKESFHGSMNGLRYRLHCHKEEDETTLEACIWPEPFCYDKTEETLKMTSEHAFSEKGLGEAIDWINERYEERSSQ